MNSMKQDIENIIKKNLPEKKEMTMILTSTGRDLPEEYKVPNTEWNDCLSQIDPSLIADEVLKVVEENYRQAFIKTFLGAGELWFNYMWENEEEKKESMEGVDEYWKDLLANLSPNKENE